jgi:4-azaleucine resistance transporter AzlC
LERFARFAIRPGGPLRRQQLQPGPVTEGRIEAPRERFARGFRAAVPVALASMVLAASFGVVAQQAGLSDLAAIVMSIVVFAGSAQFAAISVLTGGGSLAAALVAASLMNSRFLAMGVALTPSLSGGRLRRAIEAQTIVDASWAMALKDDGSFDRYFLFGATAVQYLTWTTGTVIGVAARSAIGNPNRFGLDAIFPAFFLALLLSEARHPASRWVALAGAAISLALTPFTPPGVPILAASAAALWGLRSA